MLNTAITWLAQEVFVDLGTATTRVAHGATGQARQLPSVVALHLDGTALRLREVGDDAARMVERAPHQVQVRSPFSNGRCQDIEVAGVFLRHLLSDTPARSEWKPLRLVFAHAGPHAGRAELTAAARLAGVREVSFVPASVAAAAGAGLDLRAPHLVADLGASATRVSALHRGTVVAHIEVPGGLDLVREVQAAVSQRAGLEISHSASEKLVTSHGFPLSAYLAPALEVAGKDRERGLPSRRVLERGLLAPEFQAHLQGITQGVRALLAALPPALRGHLTPKGLLLFGGGASAKGLARLLQASLAMPVVTDHAPHSTALRGLPRVAHAFATARPIEPFHIELAS